MIKKIGIILGSLVFTTSALANPLGGVVTDGSATISSPNAQTVVVNQTSTKAVIDWNSFNIASGEKTEFVQPAGGIALNRINPEQGASQIYGQLTATGKIILVNQSGIFFGPTAQVDVGGIIASTTDITNQNFMQSDVYQFNQPSSYAGSVINEGSIIAEDNGLVALLGNAVSNDGTIQANLGKVILASGSEYTVDLTGDQLINFAINAPSAVQGVDQNGNPINGVINNDGVIIANGGTVTLSAQAARAVLDNVINMNGIIQADSVDDENGRIILSGGDQGIVNINGALISMGLNPGQTGGQIQALGQYILLGTSALLNVQGDQGGGDIFVGGNYHGAGPLPNAKAVVALPGATLQADALTQGNGGQVIVWSNDATKFYGTISARGGANGGDGGFVETSGSYLDVNGIRVDASAPMGQAGTWLLDPYNVTISNASDNAGSYSSDIWSPTGTGSNVNIPTLESNLASADINITTGSSGGESGDITVVDPISWSSAHSLTLTAANDITINGAISIGTGGSLILDSAVGGTQAAAISGSGALVIQGSGTLTLSNTISVASLTANTALSLDGGSITTTGNQTYNSALTLVGTATLTSTAGNISIASVNGLDNNLSLIGGNNADHQFTVSGDATNITSFSVNGGSGGNSTLTLSDSADKIWTIDASNGGSVNIPGEATVSFSNVQNLVGGSGADTFSFAAGGSVTSINGGDTTVDHNHLDYTGYGSGVVVNTSAPIGGVIDSGTVTTSNTMSFSQIQRVIGDEPSVANNFLNLASKSSGTYVITYTDIPTDVRGYVNDPFYFDWFNVNLPAPTPNNNSVIATIPSVVTPFQQPDSTANGGETIPVDTTNNNDNMDSVMNSSLDITNAIPSSSVIGCTQ